MTVLKIILVVLTLIYPLFMTILTGAGIVYNRSSYGSTITGHGISLIVSGIIISAAAFLCIFRKSFLNLIAPITSLIGSGVCMRALLSWSVTLTPPVGTETESTQPYRSAICTRKECFRYSQSLCSRSLFLPYSTSPTMPARNAEYSKNIVRIRRTLLHLLSSGMKMMNDPL